MGCCLSSQSSPIFRGTFWLQFPRKWARRRVQPLSPARLAQGIWGFGMVGWSAKLLFVIAHTRHGTVFQSSQADVVSAQLSQHHTQRLWKKEKKKKAQFALSCLSMKQFQLFNGLNEPESHKEHLRREETSISQLDAFGGSLAGFGTEGHRRHPGLGRAVPPLLPRGRRLGEGNF